MTSSLGDLLANRREAILAEWRRRIFATYPEPARAVFTRSGDRFRNPVGDVIRRGTEDVVDAVLRDAPSEELATALDGIVRLRAVQDFPPSEAVAFVFVLKDVIRTVLGRDPQRAEFLSDLDRSVDRIALLAFDVYAGCRERIGEIRVSEAKARVMKLLERVPAGERTGVGPGGETR